MYFSNIIHLNLNQEVKLPQFDIKPFETRPGLLQPPYYRLIWGDLQLVHLYVSV